MQIRNKYYPYPVIADGNDSYESSSFTSDADRSTTAHQIKFALSAEIHDDMLQKMLSEGTVKYAHHIECPQTCYRKLVVTDKPYEEISVHESLLNGLVQICSFLMAAKDIKGYANPNFSRDYRGFKFNIDQGCIMAIGSQINITINKDKEDIARTSSIFTIHKDHDPNHTELSINTDGPKIVILIPEKTCNQYLSVSSSPDLTPILHAMIIMPALMQALYELKQASLLHQLFYFDDFRWFKALRKAASKQNIPFEEDDLAQMDVFVTAQKLLDIPIIKAMSFICSGEEDEND